MICPYCDANDDRVIDSRATDAGKVVRRRRACNKCGKRFTTYERVEESARLTVVKRDGSREAFDREKIVRSVRVACGKRPISEEAKAEVVDGVEEELHHEFEREAPTRAIAEKVMAKLKELDDVAYVRYASEHYRFTAEDIRREVEQLAEVREKEFGRKHQQPLFEF